MKTLLIIAVFITYMTSSACSGQSMPDLNPEITSAPTPAASLSINTQPDCLGDDINPMGKSIADDYAFANYEQVMTWFCDGAEFEDILVALETELQIEYSAEEMLALLSKGFSWEDIWQHAGIID
jgi:hypothetical protein